MSKSQSGPSLADDLYSLYLAGLGWLLLPVYGDGFANVLPSDVSSLDRTIDVCAVLAVLAAAWVGFRGGPLLLNRAAVLHELGSPKTRRQMLLPRLVRQGVAVAALAAIGVTVLLAMSSPNGFGFSSAIELSLVAGGAMLCAVATAVCWLVLFKSEDDLGVLRPVILGVNIVSLVAMIAITATGRTFTSGVGAVVLLAVTVAALALAFVVVPAVPVNHLWRRASALEDMRSAMVSFDFQQVLVNLRRAVDQTESGRQRAPLTRRWMPMQFWRYLASAQHGILGRIATIVVTVGGVAVLLAVADPGDGIVALGVAAAGFALGIELSSSVAATAGHITALVHYPKGSANVLRGQVATALALALFFGGLAVAGFAVGHALAPTAALVVLFMFGTLAACAQGRLGSPDLTAMASLLGPGGLGPALWARALLGPLLTILVTILLSHGWLQPSNVAVPWAALVSSTVVITAVVATFPLERYAR